MQESTFAVCNFCRIIEFSCRDGCCHNLTKAPTTETNSAKLLDVLNDVRSFLPQHDGVPCLVVMKTKSEDMLKSPSPLEDRISTRSQSFNLLAAFRYSSSSILTNIYYRLSYLILENTNIPTAKARHAIA